MTDKPEIDEVKRRLAADRAIGVLALTIPAAFWRAYCFWQVWSWLAPPEWPKLPFRGALMLWFLWLLVPRAEPKEADPLMPWSMLLFRSFGYPLIGLLLAGITTWLIR